MLQVGGGGTTKFSTMYCAIRFEQFASHKPGSVGGIRSSIKLATCATSPPPGSSAASYSGGKPSPAKPWQLAQPLLYISLPVVPVIAPVELLLEELDELLLEDEVLVDVLLDDELEELL